MVRLQRRPGAGKHIVKAPGFQQEKQDQETPCLTINRGSSGSCVGTIQFPPLCKGRLGGVEAFRGWASRESRGWCKPARFLPPHAPPYKGGGTGGRPHPPPPDSNNRGDSLGNHPRPSKHPHDFRKSLNRTARADSDVSRTRLRKDNWGRADYSDQPKNTNSAPTITVTMAAIARMKGQ
jgi:hypothetical protein